MADFQDVLKAEELEAQGIPCTSTSEISVNQAHLNRGQSFSLNCRKAAIALAESYRQTGVNCLVIESQLHLTLWYEGRNT